jgi:sulfur carrier protein
VGGLLEGIRGLAPLAPWHYGAAMVTDRAPVETLADAVRALQPRGPFAAAVNMTFVPRTLYNDTQLNAGDRIELIAPVTGG